MNEEDLHMWFKVKVQQIQEQYSQLIQHFSNYSKHPNKTYYIQSQDAGARTLAETMHTKASFLLREVAQITNSMKLPGDDATQRINKMKERLIQIREQLYYDWNGFAQHNLQNSLLQSSMPGNQQLPNMPSMPNMPFSGMPNMPYFPVMFQGAPLNAPLVGQQFLQQQQQQQFRYPQSAQLQQRAGLLPGSPQQKTLMNMQAIQQVQSQKKMNLSANDMLSSLPTKPLLFSDFMAFRSQMQQGVSQQVPSQRISSQQQTGVVGNNQQLGVSSNTSRQQEHTLPWETDDQPQAQQFLNNDEKNPLLLEQQKSQNLQIQQGLRKEIEVVDLTGVEDTVDNGPCDVVQAHIPMPYGSQLEKVHGMYSRIKSVVCNGGNAWIQGTKCIQKKDVWANEILEKAQVAAMEFLDQSENNQGQEVEDEIVVNKEAENKINETTEIEDEIEESEEEMEDLEVPPTELIDPEEYGGIHEGLDSPVPSNEEAMPEDLDIDDFQQDQSLQLQSAEQETQQPETQNLTDSSNSLKLVMSADESEVQYPRNNSAKRKRTDQGQGQGQQVNRQSKQAKQTLDSKQARRVSQRVKERQFEGCVQQPQSRTEDGRLKLKKFAPARFQNSAIDPDCVVREATNASIDYEVTMREQELEEAALQLKNLAEEKQQLAMQWKSGLGFDGGEQKSDQRQKRQAAESALLRCKEVFSEKEYQDLVRYSASKPVVTINPELFKMSRPYEPNVYFMGILEEDSLVWYKGLSQAYAKGSSTLSQSSSLRQLLMFGTTHKVLITEIAGKGYGVVSAEDIPAGQFLMEYTGELISIEEAASRSEESEKLKSKGGCPHNYQWEIGEHDAICPLNKTIWQRSYRVIDARHEGNVARYVNHSCNPNLTSFMLKSRIGAPRVLFCSIKTIPKGCELTLDYDPSGTAVNNPTKYKLKDCKCKEVNCKGKMI